MRVYDEKPARGYKVLVDRVWPRGKTKEEVHMDLWMKEVAPSTDLRKWFGHDPEKWGEFRKSYFKELAGHRDEVERLVEKASEGDLLLLYGAKDEEHNQAVALKEYLDKKMHA
jgi:uncharacterized protein YeaO (DUF488 family)